MEHPFIGLHHELTGGQRGMFDVAGLFDLPKPKYLYQWLVQHRGPLASNIAEGVGHVRSDSSLPAPDLQLLFAPAFFHNNGETTHTAPAYTMAISMVGPRSRGSVMIGSPDPQHKAAVRLNLFDDPADIQAMVRGLRLLREIAAAEPLKTHTGREFLPGPAAADDAALTDYIRRECQHTYHPSCTVRMGTPDDAALDPQLRVYGIEGLRVADTSVFPTITRGNTNAPAIMVGERCADFIRNPSGQ